MPTVLLTPGFIAQNLKCINGKKTEYCDSELPGHLIEVRPSSEGRGTHRFRQKIDGKMRHYTLGRVGEITLEEARQRAKALKAEAKLAQSPKPEAESEGSIDFKTFALDHYLPAKRNLKRSIKDDEGMLNYRLIPIFGDQGLGGITRQDIQQFITELKASGLSGGTCNRHRALLSHMFTVAGDLGFYSGTNPVSRIQRFEEVQRERYLSEDEMQRLLSVLETDDNRVVCCLFKLLLVTGCRLSEWLKADWSMVDLDRRLFTVPATNSKSKKVRSVPLNQSALEVLEELEQFRKASKGNWLFVNPRSTEGKPYTNVNKAWYRIRAKAGLDDLRIHDMRHNFASQLVNCGRSLYEVQQLLGHGSPVVTQRYSHLSASTLQEAAEAASVGLRNATK